MPSRFFPQPPQPSATADSSPTPSQHHDNLLSPQPSTKSSHPNASDNNSQTSPQSHPCTPSKPTPPTRPVFGPSPPPNHSYGSSAHPFNPKIVGNENLSRAWRQLYQDLPPNHPYRRSAAAPSSVARDGEDGEEYDHLWHEILDQAPLSSPSITAENQDELPPQDPQPGYNPADLPPPTTSPNGTLTVPVFHRPAITIKAETPYPKTVVKVLLPGHPMNAYEASIRIECQCRDAEDERSELGKLRKASDRKHPRGTRFVVENPLAGEGVVREELGWVQG